MLIFLRMPLATPISAYMEYLDNKTSWEDVFTSELEALQQKMPSFDIESLSKSKLRLSLENKLLDWKKYEAWATETYGCASLKENLSEATLKTYSMSAQQTYSVYASYGFWNQDLLPIFIWENQVVVFGLQYSPNLIKIPNHIFILTTPRVLNFFANMLLANKPFSAGLSELENIFSDGDTSLDGLATDVQPISIDFKDLSSETVTNYTPRPRKPYKSQQSDSEIWDLVGERFEEYVFESRKKFDAFVILRINYDLTNIFKLDPDLAQQNINEKLFEYNLRLDNPFKAAKESGNSEVLPASQLGLDPLNYTNVCITPLLRSNNVVGFFVGFKNQKPSEDDLEFLEELAQETAQAS